MPLDSRQIDFLCAAFHEAGHFVIGRYVGLIHRSAWIFPNFRRDLPNEKSWAGVCSAYTAELNRLSLRKRIMYSVAGFVAEARLLQTPFDMLPEFLHDSQNMSESDWEGTKSIAGQPTKKFIRTAEEVATLLQGESKLWQQVREMAGELIANAFETYPENRCFP